MPCHCHQPHRTLRCKLFAARPCSGMQDMPPHRMAAGLVALHDRQQPRVATLSRMPGQICLVCCLNAAPVSSDLAPHQHQPPGHRSELNSGSGPPMLGRPVVPGTQVVPWQTNLCLCTSHITDLTRKHVPHSHQRKRPLRSLQTQVKPFTLPI